VNFSSFFYYFSPPYLQFLELFFFKVSKVFYPTFLHTEIHKKSTLETNKTNSPFFSFSQCILANDTKKQTKIPSCWIKIITYSTRENPKTRMKNKNLSK